MKKGWYFLHATIGTGKNTRVTNKLNYGKLKIEREKGGNRTIRENTVAGKHSLNANKQSINTCKMCIICYSIAIAYVQ